MSWKLLGEGGAWESRRGLDDSHAELEFTLSPEKRTTVNPK
jgi:hypothetical protein